MELLEKIWVEKYRPSKIEDFIGNKNIIDKFKYFINNNDIPNILLFGPAGTGKTSLAKIIVKNTDCEYMFLNGSDENNVDTVRTKIKNFSSGMGFKKFKVVFIDECLEENTLVWILRNGQKMSLPIKDLDDQTDLVMSFNLDSKIVEWRPFDKLDKGKQELYEIEFENNEKVYCTKNHKWYVKVENEIKILKTEEIFNKLLEDNIFIYNPQN